MMTSSRISITKLTSYHSAASSDRYQRGRLIERRAVADMAGNEPPDWRVVLVAYASETGNSQDVAEELGGLAERLHFRVRLCELDAVQAVRTMISTSRGIF